MQPLADLLKLIFKEDFVPEGANRLLFQIAPLVSVVTAVTAIAMIPFGDPIHVDGYRIQLVGANVVGRRPGAVRALGPRPPTP